MSETKHITEQSEEGTKFNFSSKMPEYVGIFPEIPDYESPSPILKVVYSKGKERKNLLTSKHSQKREVGKQLKQLKENIQVLRKNMTSIYGLTSEEKEIQDFYSRMPDEERELSADWTHQERKLFYEYYCQFTPGERRKWETSNLEYKHKELEMLFEGGFEGLRSLGELNRRLDSCIKKVGELTFFGR